MQSHIRRVFVLLSVFLLAGCAGERETALTGDPLPSWNEGQTKSAIIGFVQGATDEGSSNFIPIPERIATFDNDGTLWSEQPMYFQVLFALDRIKELAPQHPEWQNTEPFKSVLADDMSGVMASGMAGLEKVIFATHADITLQEFSDAVSHWISTAKHPTKNMPYTSMVYQPMLELLDYLRANDFQTFIVSGGGIDFMRVFSDPVYGIPPPQVVGSQVDAKFEMQDGIPVIVKEGKISFMDDKVGKPVGIYRHIGYRPVFAAGNSDGDLEMLEYTTIPRGSGDTSPRFGLIVHHTDAEREWAYDRDSHIGKLDKALDVAPERGWVVVDMKVDWSRIYPESGN